MWPTEAITRLAINVSHLVPCPKNMKTKKSMTVHATFLPQYPYKWKTVHYNVLHMLHTTIKKKHFFQEQHKLGGIMPGLDFGWRELAWSVHFTPSNLFFLAPSFSFFSHKWFYRLYLVRPNIYCKYFSKMFTWIVCKNIMFALVQGFWEIRLKERTTNKRLKSISFI